MEYFYTLSPILGLLKNISFFKLRSFILEKTFIREILNLDLNVFSSVVVNNAVIKLQKSPNNESNTIIKYVTNLNLINGCKVYRKSSLNGL